MGVLPGIRTIPGIMPRGLLLLATSGTTVCGCHCDDYRFLFPVSPERALPAPGIRLSPFIVVLVRPERLFQVGGYSQVSISRCLLPGNLRFQDFPGEMYSAFDGSQWFLQHVCNLKVFVTLIIEHKWLLKDTGQMIHSHMDIFHL